MVCQQYWAGFLRQIIQIARHEYMLIIINMGDKYEGHGKSSLPSRSCLPYQSWRSHEWLNSLWQLCDCWMCYLEGYIFLIVVPKPIFFVHSMPLQLHSHHLELILYNVYCLATNHSNRTFARLWKDHRDVQKEWQWRGGTYVYRQGHQCRLYKLRMCSARDLESLQGQSGTLCGEEKFKHTRFGLFHENVACFFPLTIS